jgi:Zn-dependent M16 (insulinase) family peptidase
MGHIYSSGRASRFNSRAKMVEERYSGISQIEFVHQLAGYDTGEIIKKLQYIREKIIKAGLIVNVTGNALNAAGAEIAQRFYRFGPPLPRLSAEISGNTQTPEVFASRSLQVGFAALTFNAAPFDTLEQAVEIVLTHQLSTGALWEDIRMKGGAYGAFINSNSLDNCVSFATYRDPNPLRSLDVISSIFKNSSYGKCSEDYLIKSIIGCYSKETHPHTAPEKGLMDFYRFLHGVEESYQKRKLERLISVSTTDIETVFNSLGSRVTSQPVIIAGVKKAEEAAKTLGTDVRMLKI